MVNFGGLLGDLSQGKWSGAEVDVQLGLQEDVQLGLQEAVPQGTFSVISTARCSRSISFLNRIQSVHLQLLSVLRLAMGDNLFFN